MPALAPAPARPRPPTAPAHGPLCMRFQIGVAGKAAIGLGLPANAIMLWSEVGVARLRGGAGCKPLPGLTLLRWELTVSFN